MLGIVLWGKAHYGQGGLEIPNWPGFEEDFFSEVRATPIVYGRWSDELGMTCNPRRFYSRDVDLYFMGQLVAHLEMWGLETRFPGVDHSFADWGVRRVKYATFERTLDDEPRWIEKSYGPFAVSTGFCDKGVA